MVIVQTYYNKVIDHMGRDLDTGGSGLASVTWSNDQGGNGIASGMTNWSVANIVLQPGDNVITVTATDGAGNSSTEGRRQSVAYARMEKVSC